MKNFVSLFTAIMCSILFMNEMQAQTPEKNMAAVKAAYQEMSIKHTTTRWEASCTLPGGYIPYWPGQRSNLKSAFVTYFNAIPNAQFTVEQIEAEGNVVTVTLHTTGTFKNKFLDWEPTGKSFSYRSIHTLTFDNKGKLIDGWPFADPAQYLQ